MFSNALDSQGQRGKNSPNWLEQSAPSQVDAVTSKCHPWLHGGMFQFGGTKACRVPAAFQTADLSTFPRCFPGDGWQELDNVSRWTTSPFC